jgi:chromosome segregation ATPase
LQQLEDQAAAAQQELEGLASRLAATTSRAEDAESARDAATGEGRWLRVKLANEAEGRREAEARLEATVSELKAQVTGRVETHWKKATAGVACQPQRRQWGIGKEQCKEGRH